MASGMETLMNTLLKAAGFNPAEFSQGISGFVDGVQGQLTSFDARLTAVERSLATLQYTADEILAVARGLETTSPETPGILTYGKLALISEPSATTDTVSIDGSDGHDNTPVFELHDNLSSPPNKDMAN